MGLLNLLVVVVVLGLVFGVIWWGIQQIGLPEPFRKVAIAIFVLVVVIVLVGLLLGHFPVPVYLK
jgi:hypothetical protein